MLPSRNDVPTIVHTFQQNVPFQLISICWISRIKRSQTKLILHRNIHYIDETYNHVVMCPVSCTYLCTIICDVHRYLPTTITVWILWTSILKLADSSYLLISWTIFAPSMRTCQRCWKLQSCRHKVPLAASYKLTILSLTNYTHVINMKYLVDFSIVLMSI